MQNLNRPSFSYLRFFVPVGLHSDINGMASKVCAPETAFREADARKYKFASMLKTILLRQKRPTKITLSVPRKEVLGNQGLSFNGKSPTAP